MSSSVSSPVVRAVELAKWWAPDVGLRPVTFAVAAGEVVVVVGRSGSGKSTLLAMLAGWCAPDEGTLELFGASVAITTWQQVALVPQVLGLVPELTMRENVALGLPGRTERSLALATTLTTFDLDEFADRLPADTSMGQRQRTAVARALVGQPGLVVADEPTSHQDPDHAVAVLGALRAAAARGSAVVVASHAAEVIAAADRTVALTT